ncbi:response regulator transcription factor [Helicobacter muridarum]|uniref:Response regulator transcription factor n=1 Tax=Helicobacter muridarum TaxID=216 RepID=A0A099TZW7_9HELI|nr:homeostatic response regulator transcription factor HsrA [Helicobacter muridarum]TLE00831.1 response regulator transcription factor [Helicobacter muridarum]STQ86595.1 two-component system response regulator [Helicobacter muridarum]
MRILVIHNNKETVEYLNRELSKNSYQVDVAHNMKDGEYHISVRSYDLILCAWKLSDAKPGEVVFTVKEKCSRVPLIVTGEPNIGYEIASFKAGADDYLVEPLDIEVLLVHIQARLKLWGSSLIEIGDLVIIPDEERITYKGIEVGVKGKPFEVLTHLARQKDQIVSKDQLLNAIWNEPELVTPNVIEVAINQIRQKMDKPLNINTIETVRRRGYRFCYPKK